MLHIIAYDISSDRRLRNVARICEDYGVRIEKSVFECNLNETEFNKIWEKLSEIATDSDSIIDYPVAQSHQAKIRTLGTTHRYTPTETLVF